MTLKTRVVQVKKVHVGTGISYGLTWTAPDRATIATLAIGYADGLPRVCSNEMEMLIRGERAHQVGRICMDLTLLDVCKVPSVKLLSFREALLGACRGMETCLGILDVAVAKV